MEAHLKSGKNQEPKFNSERIVLAGLLGIYFTGGGLSGTGLLCFGCIIDPHSI